MNVHLSSNSSNCTLELYTGFGMTRKILPKVKGGKKRNHLLAIILDNEKKFPLWSGSEETNFTML